MEISFQELLGPLNSIQPNGLHDPNSSLFMTNGPSTITDAKPLFTTTTGTSEQDHTVTVTTLLHTANIAAISDQIFAHLPALLPNATSHTTHLHNDKSALHYFLITTPGGTATSRPKPYEYHLWLTRPRDKTYKGDIIEAIEHIEHVEPIVTDATDQLPLSKQQLKLLSVRHELSDAMHAMHASPVIFRIKKLKCLEERVKTLEASIEELEKLEKLEELEELAAKETSKVDSNVDSKTATPSPSPLPASHTITLASYTDVSMKDFESQIYNDAIKTTREMSRTTPVSTTLNGTITLTPAAHECTTASIKLTMQYTPPTKTPASGTGTGAVGSTFGSQIASLANNARTHLGTTASTSLGTVSSRNTLPPASTLANNLLANITAITSHLHQHYSSYDHVDRVTYTNFAANLDTCPSPLPHETSLLDTSVYYANPPTTTLPRSLASHNTVTTSYRVSEEKEGSVWGKAVATIDTAAAQVLAYLFCLDAPGRNLAYVRDGGGFRQVERVGVRSVLCCWEDSSSTRNTSTRNTGRSTAHGMHGVWCVWRKEADGSAHDSYTLAVAPIEEYPVEDEAKERMTEMMREFVKKNKMGGSNGFKSSSFSSSSSADTTGATGATGATGGGRGVWRIRRIADNVTEVTYVAQGGFASSDLPVKALMMKIKAALMTVDKLQDRFERNGKLVDEEVRKATEVMDSPSLDELERTDEKRGFFLMCQAICGDDCSEGASFVEMQTTRNRTKRGNSSAALSYSRGTSMGTSRMATMQSTKKVASMTIRSVLGLRATDSDWVDLPSPSPFVTLGMKFLAHPPESPDHDVPIILARGEVVVDCSLDDAYTWMLFNTSRERTKTAYERGDLAHVEVKADTFYDRTTATIRKMPWRLTNREYVTRQLGILNPNSTYSIGLSSDPTVVDYGTSFRTLRGSMIGFIDVESNNHGRIKQSKITFTVKWDGRGNPPVWAMRPEIDRTLNILNDARLEFQRDDEIDDSVRKVLSKNIGKKKETIRLRPEERIILDSLKTKLDQLDDRNFDCLESPDKRVWMGLLEEGLSSCVVGRASSEVHASVEDCAAYEMSKMTRDVIKNENSLERDLTKMNDHQNVFHVASDVSTPGFQPREFVMLQIWHATSIGDADKVVVVYYSVDRDNIPEVPDYIRGDFQSYWVFERLPELNGLPRTRAICTVEVDLRGVGVPTWVSKKEMLKTLTVSMTYMVKHYDKREAMERGRRLQILSSMNVDGNINCYSDDEKRKIDDAMKDFFVFQAVKAMDMATASPLVRAQIAHKAGDHHALGWATAKVKASAAEVTAWMINKYSEDAPEGADDLEWAVDERLNGHNWQVYNKKRAANSFSASREYLNRILWKKREEVGEGAGYIFAAITDESQARAVNSSWKSKNAASAKVLALVNAKMTSPAVDVGGRRGSSIRGREAQLKKAVRGKNPSCMKVLVVNEKESTIQYVVHPDGGGGLSSWHVSRNLSAQLQVVTDIQVYFQRIRELGDWDEDDGRCVGEMLMAKSHDDREKIKKKRRDLFKEVRGLREADKKYGAWYHAMMMRVLENQLRPIFECNTKLCNVSEKEGKVIGAGLAMSIAANLTAEAGVDEWILRYPALKELDRQEVWFRPLLNVVAKRLLGDVSWGVKGRVAFGAAMGIMDMVSDIVVTVTYFKADETTGYGWTLIAMMAASVLLQLVIVFSSNHFQRKRKLLKDVIITMSGFRPAWVAYRVASGHAQEEGDVIGPKSELVAAKVIEMVCESIPGCLLQTYVLMKDEGSVSVPAVMSILISALTTGFTSASITFDYDVDPSKRIESRDFHGFVPDGSTRVVVFACMMLNSALLLLVRSFSAALLMLVSKRYLAYYLICDHVVYLAQKVVRGDFYYWVPVENDLVAIVVSLAVRTGMKAVTDFTGLIQSRHPGELGGLYWSLNVLSAFVMSAASVVVYYEKGDGDIMEQADAWTLAGVLVGAWILVFCVFLALSKKKYRVTFWSTKTGCQFVMDYFLKGTDDAVRSEIFMNNSRLWKSLRDQVMQWTMVKWWRWQEEKPAWMTDVWLSHVPLNMIPREDKKRISSIKLRRKSSLKVDMARAGGVVQPVVEGGR